jgi:hypothetical protein
MKKREKRREKGKHGKRERRKKKGKKTKRKKTVKKKILYPRYLSDQLPEISKLVKIMVKNLILYKNHLKNLQ